MSARKCFALGAGLVLFFLACNDPAGPSSADSQVSGSWAGTLDAGGVPVLVELEIPPSKKYEARISPQGLLSTRERGTWSTRAGRWHTMPETCEASDTPGGPLHLVLCGGADSLAINITGDTWTANFTAGGQVRALVLKRL